MSRVLVLAVLVLGGCDAPSNSYVSPGEPQLTSLASLDPSVRVACKSSACVEAILTTDAVSDGTITWLHPDGTSSTGTSVTVSTPDADSPLVMEVEVAYDSGDIGTAGVAIVGTRKRYLGDEEPDSAARLIVIEVKGEGCGLVSISTIGGCFSDTSPFSFGLWEGLADPSSAEPYAAVTPLAPANYTPGPSPVLSRGGADGAHVKHGTGADLYDAPGAPVEDINEAPPYMTIQVDQAAMPAVTVLPYGTQGGMSWVFTEAVTFACEAGDPFGHLMAVSGK